MPLEDVMADIDLLNIDQHDLSCPKCGYELIRVQRRFVDNLLSVFMPVLRFRCTNLSCGYESNLRCRSQS